MTLIKMAREFHLATLWFLLASYSWGQKICKMEIGRNQMQEIIFHFQDG